MSLIHCFRYSVIRILVVVGFLLGSHGIGHSINSYTHQSEKEQLSHKDSLIIIKNRIDSLLNRHDLCEQGVLLPDSALVYTMEAIQLANSRFGMNSEEYIMIFSDYLIPDVGDNQNMLCDYLYPMTTKILDPDTEWVWNAYYSLGISMADINENDKAIDLFERVITANSPQAAKLAAKIKMAPVKNRVTGEDMEAMLLPLLSETDSVPSPSKEDVSFMLSRKLAEYYSEINEYEKLIDIVNFGEQFIDFVPKHEAIMLLNMKYNALILYDHLSAIDCLDKIIEIADKENLSNQNDRDWLALSLVNRGDYTSSYLLNSGDALDYYLRALDVNTASMTTMNRVTLLILQRLFSISKHLDSNGLSIKIGELLLNKLIKEDNDESTLPEFVLSMVQNYIYNDELSNALNLLTKYQSRLEEDPQTAFTARLYEAQIKLFDKDYLATVHILEDLMKADIGQVNKMNAQRYLASAYSYLGDERMYDLSDSINSTTKQIISRYLPMISPSQRSNWLDICEDALLCQICLPNNKVAVKNALELNLFKKSLLLRTSTSIRQIASNLQSSSDYDEDITDLHERLMHSISRGDSLEVIKLRKEYDELEQRAANTYFNENSLFPFIDVTVNDVLRNLNDNSVAVDFISISKEDNNHLGAFIFAKDKDPKYLSLVEYADSITINGIDSIWNNIIPEITGYNDLYFCTDGPLNNIAIEYTPIGCNQHIFDIIKPHRVFHLSDIKKSNDIGSKICFIGVADHNSPLKEEQENTRGDWSDLPNVQSELASMRNHIPSKHMTVLMNESATEANFKNLEKSDLSTLHVSTHGVYRDQKSLINSAQNPSSADYYIARRLLSANESSLSALILHRGNPSWKASQITTDEDDILTAEEIELMNFQNLNLTVLSACDTGLGEIDSEGVWGLQRAFRMAGTKSLICSLTKVDDYWTAQFMDAFYEQAAKGKSIYDSFHTAQQWLYRELPDNPEIWSSFILIE